MDLCAHCRPNFCCSMDNVSLPIDFAIGHTSYGTYSGNVEFRKLYWLHCDNIYSFNWDLFGKITAKLLFFKF